MFLFGKHGTRKKNRYGYRKGRRHEQATGAACRGARILGSRCEGFLEPFAAWLRPSVYAALGISTSEGLIRCRPERGLIDLIGELPAAEGADVVPQQGVLIVDDHQGCQVEPDGDVRIQKGNLMMTGVLSPMPSSRYRTRSPECASQNAR